MIRLNTLYYNAWWAIWAKLKIIFLFPVRQRITPSYMWKNEWAPTPIRLPHMLGAGLLFRLVFASSCMCTWVIPDCQKQGKNKQQKWHTAFTSFMWTSWLFLVCFVLTLDLTSVKGPLPAWPAVRHFLVSESFFWNCQYRHIVKNVPWYLPQFLFIKSGRCFYLVLTKCQVKLIFWLLFTHLMMYHADIHKPAK